MVRGTWYWQSVKLIYFLWPVLRMCTGRYMYVCMYTITIRVHVPVTITIHTYMYVLVYQCNYNYFECCCTFNIFIHTCICTGMCRLNVFSCVPVHYMYTWYMYPGGEESSHQWSRRILPPNSDFWTALQVTEHEWNWIQLLIWIVVTSTGMLIDYCQGYMNAWMYGS